MKNVYAETVEINTQFLLTSADPLGDLNAVLDRIDCEGRRIISVTCVDHRGTTVYTVTHRRPYPGEDRTRD